MSVVSVATRRRWAAVAAGVALLAGVPAVTAAATNWITAAGAGPAPAPEVLLARLDSSDGVPHQGLAESRGNLGLPDLPAVGDVAATLGGTTRTRVWWAGPDRWRVDVLTASGEQGVYRHGTGEELWNYEENRLTLVPREPPVRLPRADDLLPPQAARRLLHRLDVADRVTGLGAPRVIAGVVADGVRVTPAGADSTIGHVDVWLDREHGLPVEFSLVDRRGVTALTSRFTTLSFARPAARTLRSPEAPDASRSVDEAPDIASRIQRFGNQAALPERLAGLASSTPVAGAARTYGSGLVTFAVLPLPSRLADRVFGAARDGGGTTSQLPGGAESVALSNGILSVVVTRRDRDANAYVLAGLVEPVLLTGAAEQLMGEAPPL